MCGILFHYSEGSSNNFDDYSEDTLFKSLIPIIRERGRDYERSTHVDDITLYSSVLSLRQPLVKQPLIDERFVIQFNGELYNDEISENMNDVEFLHHLLIKNEGNVHKTIGSLKGEFAFTIYDTLESIFYFGKDAFGRKSLCFSDDEMGDVYISSCFPTNKSKRTKFKECEKGIVYYYDIVSRVLGWDSFNESDDLPNFLNVLNDYNREITYNQDEIITELHEKLSKAVKRRISTIFPLEKDKTDSKFAVLFSGGIDCTLICGLSGELCEQNTTIDLLNVSFSNPRANLSYDETPDRMLAIKNCNELNQVYNKKGVYFNLIKVNVPYDEYLKAKQRVIDLIYPNDTEMDLSIAIAFYFATSGKNSEGKDSNCKVLLSGLGADEIFGGYTRHERIFTGISNQIRRKLQGKPVKDETIYDINELQKELRDELQVDIDRLWERNLMRDDKVISCWNKEARYPFLDEELNEWCTSMGKIPLTMKLNFNEETGEITRKLALRELAKYMKLDFVSQEAKRAIQFGSKSAKMDVGSGKVKGTDKL